MLNNFNIFAIFAVLLQIISIQDHYFCDCGIANISNIKRMFNPYSYFIGSQGVFIVNAILLQYSQTSSN